MSVLPEAAELLRVLRVNDFRRYLTDRGWNTIASRNPDVFRFTGPSSDAGEPIVAVIPISEDFDDYPVRAWELISLLSTLENRSTWDVVRDVVTSGVRADASEVLPSQERSVESQEQLTDRQDRGKRASEPRPAQQAGATRGHKATDLTEFTTIGRLSAAYPGSTINRLSLIPSERYRVRDYTDLTIRIPHGHEALLDLCDFARKVTDT